MSSRSGRCTPMIGDSFICSGCRKKLSRDDFHKSTLDGKTGRHCKRCMQYTTWKTKLRNVYGITPERYFEILEAQGLRCAICKDAWPPMTRWPVDHDHMTGEVRGVLCQNCNLLLGHARDNKEILSGAIGYLESPPARSC